MKLIQLMRSHWFFLVIFSAALVVRVWNIESLTTFSGDQGRDFLEVKKILNGNPTLLGPKLGPSSSFGNIYLGPVYYYMLAPVLWVFKLNPIGPSYLMVFFSLGTLITIYYISTKFISRKVAMLSSILWTCNPEIIEQSRVALNPFPIPFFSSLVILSLFKIIKGNSNLWLWPITVGISCGVLFQLHYLSIPFVFIAFATLVVYKKRQQFIFAILFFIGTISPEILFELKHKFFITSQILDRISTGQEISSPVLLKAQLLSSVKILSKTFFNTETQAYLTGIIFLIFAIVVFIKNKNWKFIVFLLLSNTVLTIIAASSYPMSLQLHYFATIYPAIILLISMIAVYLLENINNLLAKTILILLFAQIIITSVMNINLSKQEGYTMPNGWNMKGQKKASDLIINDPDSTKLFNVASTLDGDTRSMPIRYLVTIQKRYPQDVEHYPDSQTIFLIARDKDEEIKKYNVWEVSSFAPFNVINLGQIQNGIYLYKLKKI